MSLLIKNLDKHFANGKHALRDINLAIGNSEMVALIGASGSGKSTLMNILGCLDTPTKGDYILNGTNVSHMSDNELAEVRNKEIGFVFQTFNLLPRLSALENVELPLIYFGLGKKARKERAEEVLVQLARGLRNAAGLHHCLINLQQTKTQMANIHR